MVITLRTMVRPWMVALLVLLTGRRSFGIGQPAVAHAEVAPASTVNTTEISSIGCKYKGRSYEAGSLVKTDQPCLKCTCVTGNLVCHLQVCSELPDPPPQGCVIVHKKNKCCAHLQCYYGCVVNGTIYAEGSAMDSSSLCEYCYCIKGYQQCVRPQCSLTIPGCTAVFKKHTCCPVRYKCSAIQNMTVENITDEPPATTETPLSARFKDCRINGRLISLGEPVIGVARSSCETCFCINGQVRCDKVICPPIRAQISPNCGPVYSEGHCCPTSYNCTTNNDSNVISPTTTTTTTTTTTAMATSTMIVTSPSTTTVDDDILISSSLPPSQSSSPSTVSTVLVETENTTIAYNVDTTNTTDPMESRHANPAGLMLDEFGGLNVTEKSNNFEMDYDEPTLPPSLPNLKIIPFVAADAVFDEPAAVYDSSYQPIERVFNVSDVEERLPPVGNSFSPPIETEGGFVPKDPPDGAIYVPDKFRTTTERVLVKPIVHLDEPVIGHKPTGSVWCMSNGKKYKHGELLTDPSACNICVCISAKVVCQENCPAVKVGCQRISDPNNITCCGRIVCNESANDITTEYIKQSPEVTSEITTTTVKHRDAVIEHIIYSAPSTEKSVLIPTSTTVKYTTSSETVSLKPIVTSTTKSITSSAPTTIKLVETLAPTTEKLAISSTFSPIKRVEITTPIPTPLEDEDYSFESMFSFLFSGDTSEQPSASSSTISSPNNMQPFETNIEHRTDDEIDEKIHIDNAKPQNDFMSFADLFGTEQTVNPKKSPNHKTNSDNIKVHSENKYNKVVPQDSDKPVEPKPNSETKQEFDIKSHFEIKQNTDTKLLPEIKQNTDSKLLPEIKQNTDTKLLPEIKNSTDTNKLRPEIKQNADTNLRPEIKPNADTKLRPEIKQNTDTKLRPEIKLNADTKVRPEIEQNPNVKPHGEIKPHVEVNSYLGIKQQAEVKTHFDVKENAQIVPQLDFKHPDKVKIPQDSTKHQTEVKSHFDVKERPAVDAYSDPKTQPEVKVYSDFPHHTEMKMPFDVNRKVEPTVKPYFDFKHQIEVKPHSDFEHRVGGGSQPEIKAHSDVRAGVKPSKIKIDADFNSVASMLKVSGCNIYGRMYRVGKIISELSNPCLECMCTEIGVHCNQLKC